MNNFISIRNEVDENKTQKEVNLDSLDFIKTEYFQEESY